MADRGWVMPSGIPTLGTPQLVANRPSSPPRVTTTIRAPTTAASEATSTVSSVLPENDMANTSEVSPTKAGSS